MLSIVNARNLLTVAALAIAAAVVFDIVQKTPEQVAAENAASIGADASATAGLLLAAHKQCKKLAIPKLPECSQHKGPLPEEQVISVSASAALAQWNGFLARCQKLYAASHCEGLVTRALAIQSQ